MKLNMTTMPEPSDARYTCYNTGGVEVEVGEFLYGFVRMIKPDAILETGTHQGISAASMALALRDNGFGKITTVEYEPIHFNAANDLFSILGIRDQVNSVLKDVLTLEVVDNQYDFIFLDTEPQLRFNEFCRFWHGLKPGGFLAIHDLAPHMGQTGETVNGMLNWPFGTMPEPMKEVLKKEAQSLHFKTPRGLFICQKWSDEFYKL
jgi:predicted O-methyltransferase YrrM